MFDEVRISEKWRHCSLVQVSTLHQVYSCKNRNVVSLTHNVWSVDYEAFSKESFTHAQKVLLWLILL